MNTYNFWLKRNLVLLSAALFSVVLHNCELYSQVQPSTIAAHRSAPESCYCYFSWTGLEGFDPTASATEKWMAQPELVKSYRKFKEELYSIAKHNEAENEIGNERSSEAAVRLLICMLENPGFLYVTKFGYQEQHPNAESPENKQSKKPYVFLHASLELKNHSKNLQELNQFLVDSLEKKKEEFQLQSHQFAGRKFFSIDVPMLTNRLYWSIEESNLTIVSSEKMFLDWKQNQKTPEPNWLTKWKTKFPQQRLTTFSYINVNKCLQALKSEIPKEHSKWMKSVGLNDAKDLVITTGLTKDGAITKGGLFFSKPNVPILRFLDQKGLQSGDLEHLSQTNTYANAFKLDVKELIKLNDKIYTETGTPNNLKKNFDIYAEQGVDIKGMIESLGPQCIVSGRLMLPNPFLGLAITAEIKDYEKFHREFERLAESTKEKSKEWPEELQFEEIEKSGKKIFGFPMLTGSKIYLSYQKDRLAISFSKRKVLKLLKPKKHSTPITAHPFVKRIFQESAQKNQRPATLIYSNSKPAIQMVYPLIQAFVPKDSKVPGSDLSVSDLPPLDVLMNGWEPSATALYRSDNSLEFSSQSTFPIFTPGPITGLSMAFLPFTLPKAKEELEKSQPLEKD